MRIDRMKHGLIVPNQPPHIFWFKKQSTMKQIINKIVSLFGNKKQQQKQPPPRIAEQQYNLIKLKQLQKLKHGKSN